MNQIPHFENIDDIQGITLALKKFGIVIIGNYLSKQEVYNLKVQFYKCFDLQDPGITKKHHHPINEFGKVVRIKREKLSSTFDYIREVFGSPNMEKVLRHYYSPNDFLLNDDVFLTHEKTSEKNILPWHFDRQQALKFFIYLTDTNEQNGAFEFCPGTHMEGHFRANYYLLRGYSLKNFPNDIPDDEIRNPEVVSAQAGDLIIFDADGFHRGGKIGHDKERLVIRGHSHPLPIRGYHTRLFSKEWWLRTPLNLGKVIGSSVGRVLGDSSESQASKTREDVYKEI